MIPLMLDVSKYKVLLFGAGKVGFRKIKPFFENGSSITVVSKSVSEPLPKEVSFKEADVSKISEDELSSLIKDYDVIISALPDKNLNEKVCKTAEKFAKLCNSSDGDGNFMLPAAFCDGDFTFAVSTNGKAPAVPRYVRNCIREDFKNINAMISLQSELRERLKKSCESQEMRAKILEEILEDEEIWQALKDYDKAKNLAEKYLN